MRDNEQTLKIELLSQWKLEAEFRNKNPQKWYNDCVSYWEQNRTFYAYHINQLQNNQEPMAVRVGEWLRNRYNQIFKKLLQTVSMSSVNCVGAHSTSSGCKICSVDLIFCAAVLSVFLLYLTVDSLWLGKVAWFSGTAPVAHVHDCIRLDIDGFDKNFNNSQVVFNFWPVNPVSPVTPVQFV